MKRPTFKGWLAIAAALAAVIITIIAALGDGSISTEEAGAISEKTEELIGTVQRETAVDADTVQQK